MVENTKSIFLSYASQDAEAAQRLCEALRGAGLEVWLDRREPLRGMSQYTCARTAGSPRRLSVALTTGGRLQLWTSVHHLVFLLARIGRAEEARSLWRELGNRPAYAARHPG